MDINFTMEQEFTQSRFVEWNGDKSVSEKDPMVTGEDPNTSITKLCSELMKDLQQADNFGNTQMFTAPVSCQTLYHNHAVYAQAPSYVTVTTMATVAAESCGITAMTSPTSMSVSACFTISAPVVYTMKSNSNSLNYYIRCMQSNLPAICKCFSDSQFMHIRKTYRVVPYLAKLENSSDRRMKQHQQTITSINTFVENPSNESKAGKKIDKINSKPIKIIMSNSKKIKDDISNLSSLISTELIRKGKVKVNSSVVSQADLNKIERLATIPELLKALEYLKKIAIHNQSQQYSGTNIALSNIQSKLTDAYVGDSYHSIGLKTVDQSLSPIVIFPSVNYPRNSNYGFNKVVNLNNIHATNGSAVITSKAPKVSLASFSMYTQTNVILHDTSKIYQSMRNDLSTDPLTAILNEEKFLTTSETRVANEINKTVSIQAVASTSIAPMKSSQTIKIMLTVPNQLSAKVQLASKNSEIKEVTEASEAHLTLHSVPTITQVVEISNSNQSVNEHISDYMAPVIEEVTSSSDEIKIESPTGSENMQRKRDTVESKTKLRRTTPSKPLSKIKSIFMSHQSNQMNQNQSQTSRRSIMSSIKNITSSLIKSHEPDLEKEQREKEKEDSIYEEEYDKIYNDSREKAYEKAYNDAYKSIVGTLYDDAYNRAYIDAYESARKEASFDAYSDTYDDVFSDAYEKVYKIACDEAYIKAVKDAREKAFKDVQSYCAKKYKK